MRLSRVAVQRRRYPIDTHERGCQPAAGQAITTDRLDGALLIFRQGHVIVDVGGQYPAGDPNAAGEDQKSNDADDNTPERLTESPSGPELRLLLTIGVPAEQQPENGKHHRAVNNGIAEHTERYQPTSPSLASTAVANPHRRKVCCRQARPIPVDP